MQHHSSKCSFTSSNSWVILSPIEQSIKNKIEAAGKPLKEWDVNIYRGVLTGCNEAFIINTEKRDEILNNCADTEERTRTEALIRPILRGRDIKRYGYEWANLWLIATFPSRQYDIDEYPAVKNYLLTFAAPMLRANNFGWVAENHLQEYCYKRLEQTGKKIIINERQISFHKNEGARKKTNNRWFETQDNISYWDDFSKPKIVWAETMRRHKGKTNRFPRFSHDELGYLTDKTCFMGVGADALYIVIFLNSYMGEYLCSKYVSILDNGGYLMQKVYLNEIPIADATRKEQTNLITLWQQNCNNDKIDQFIFNIFNLDAEEKEYIYNQLGKFASIR